MEFLIEKDVKLRVLQPDDAGTLFEVVDENRLYLRCWLPWLDQNTKVEHSRDFICAVLSQLQSGKGFACGVFYNGNLVGMCGYHEMNSERQSVMIGYWLSEHFQGKGIITRCTTFFIDYAFKELGMTKILIPVAEENSKSRAVCERLGLVSEGIEPNAEFLYDRWVNHVRYSMPKDKWLGARRNNAIS